MMKAPWVPSWVAAEVKSPEVGVKTLCARKRPYSVPEYA
jgi:hypothetical protein